MRVGCSRATAPSVMAKRRKRLAPNTLPCRRYGLGPNGTPGWSFMRGMPAFSAAVVRDEEFADVHVFLASLPTPPSAAEIPLLAP